MRQKFDKYERGRFERQEERLALYDDPEFAIQAERFREAALALSEGMSLKQRAELVKVAMDTLTPPF